MLVHGLRQTGPGIALGEACAVASLSPRAPAASGCITAASPFCARLWTGLWPCARRLSTVLFHVLLRFFACIVSPASRHPECHQAISLGSCSPTSPPSLFFLLSSCSTSPRPFPRTAIPTWFSSGFHHHPWPPNAPRQYAIYDRHLMPPRHTSQHIFPPLSPLSAPSLARHGPFCSGRPMSSPRRHPSSEQGVRAAARPRTN